MAVTTLQAAVRGWRTRQVHGPRLRAIKKQAREEWFLTQLTLLQSYARGWLVRQTCMSALRQRRIRRSKFRDAVTVVQVHSRGYLVRKKYRGRLQILEKERKKRKQRMESVLTLLQANCRGYLVRNECKPKLKWFKEQRESRRVKFEAGVVRFQAVCRGYHIRNHNLTRMKRQILQEHQRQTKSREITAIPSSTEAPPITANVPPISTMTPANVSPKKPKLTLLRRLQSALKTLHISSSCPPTPSPPAPRDSNIHSSTPTLPTHIAFPPSEDESAATLTKVTSAPHLFQDHKTETLESCRREALRGQICVDQEEESLGEEDTLLRTEERALEEVMRSREEEVAIAQLARERMASIFTTEEITRMAERKKNRATYQKELECAASPLLPAAWVGVIEERLAWWKANHTPRKEGNVYTPRRRPRQSPLTDHQRPRSKPHPLTRAELLAASQLGTSLEDVVHVVLYSCCHSVDLKSLQLCPSVKAVTLVDCGVEVLSGLQGSPSILQLNLKVYGMGAPS